jgi:hypothetical protein
MSPKDFLDYLCSVEFATKREVPETKKQPQYQNQRSFNEKDTVFFSRKYEYTIQIPPAVRDATYVAATPIRGAVQAGWEEKFWSAINSFFISIGDFLSGKHAAPSRNKGGIVFTGGRGLDPIKDKADNVDRYPIDIEALLALGGAYASTESALALANAINAVKDLLSLTQEAKNAKTDTISTVSAEKTNENKKDSIKWANLSKRENFDYENINVRTVENRTDWTKYPPEGKIAKITVECETANYSSYFLLNNGDTIYINQVGDTVKMEEFWHTEDGKKHLAIREFYNNNKLHKKNP